MTANALAHDFRSVDAGAKKELLKGKKMTESLKRCPFCAEEIFASAKKCKHCGSALGGEIATDLPIGKPASDYGVLLLIVPLTATMLVWFWISGMNLLQSPGDTMVLLLLAVVLGTATVAAMEANRLGMKSDRKRGTYSPISWFLIIALMWAVGFPVYLYKRKHYGLANLALGGMLVTLIFLGSWGVMMSAIEGKKAEIQGNLEQLQKNLQSLESGTDLSNPQLVGTQPLGSPIDVQLRPALGGTADFLTLCSARTILNAKTLGGMSDAEAGQHAQEACVAAEPTYSACVKAGKAQDDCLNKALPSSE
ncbi:MAG: hypothetical protein ACRD98_10005 [Nitrososphaera sp.]